MTTRLVVVGDTHLPRFGRSLPAPLVEALAAADLVLHVGDLTEAWVLDLLAEHAPVIGVAGNNDPPELAEQIGTARTVRVESIVIGMTHGHAGRGRTTPERAHDTFAGADPPVDAVVFGHSHQPMVERRAGIWLLNPGSPTDRRRQPTFSFLELLVTAREMTPRLVEWAPQRPGPHARGGIGPATGQA